MSKVRLALIGCGGMASVHASRFAQVADRVQVVAAVDLLVEKARATADLIPGCRAVHDYRNVMDDCDAALIALPHHLHYPVGMDFLKAGKHVFMEKPLANTEQECLDLIGASRRAGKVLMVGYVQRFNPLFVRMKELIEAKRYGEMFQFSLWTEQHTEYPTTHWATRQATVGGGQLFSHGCHYIDLMLWFLGRPVEGTHTGTNCGTPWMEREGTSHVVVRFESGALGYHFGTWGARGSHLRYSFHAHCERGMIELNARLGKLIGWTNDDQQEDLLSAAEERHHMEGKPTELEMAHFIDCIETGRTPKTDGPTSLQGLRVIWRTYEAETQHKVADLRGLGLDQVDPDGNIIL